MRESSQSPLDDSLLLDPAPKNVQFIAFLIALLLDVKIASSGRKTAVCLINKRRKKDIIAGEKKLKRKEIVFVERVRRISSESNSPKFKTMLLSFNNRYVTIFF